MDIARMKALQWFHLATYCGSPFNFYIAGNAVLAGDPTATAADCCLCMQRLFGKSKWKGGPHHRWQVPGFDYYKLYFQETDENLEKQREMSVILGNLATWVENNGDSCTISAFKKELKDTHTLIHNSTCGCAQLELAEFRLTLFVQLIALSGWITKGYGILEHFYPVETRGSYKHLQKGCVKSDWQFQENKNDPNFELAMELICLETNLLYINPTWAECLLCESLDARSARDIIMNGCDLTFIMRWDGTDKPCTRRIKKFNTRVWIVPPGINPENPLVHLNDNF
jgi:hypothetical protein